MSAPTSPGRYFTCTCEGPKHGAATGCSGTGADFTEGLCAWCVAECRAPSDHALGRPNAISGSLRLTPPGESVSVELERNESILLHLLRQHRDSCQLCWVDGDQWASCALGLVLREAWFRSFELITQPTRWALVELTRPLLDAGATL